LRVPKRCSVSSTLEIKNGPSKADLLRSVTNVAKGLTTTFETDRGPIEAQKRRQGRLRLGERG
jgi:hypothetical protein